MNTKTTAYVVFGQDKEGTPRAATIPPADLEVATKAAGSMGLKVGRADTPEALSLAMPLPLVRIFATGKGLVPLVKKELYERLSKAVATIEPRTTAAEANPPARNEPSPQADLKAAPKKVPDKSPIPSKSGPSNPWALKVGNIVLVRDPEPGPDRAWWEAEILEIKGTSFLCRWQKFPALKPFKISSASITIIPPKA